MSDHQKIAEGVFTITSPVFELLASMFRLASHDNLHPVLNKSKPTQYDFIMDDWVKTTTQNLSEHVTNELAVFFSFESFFGLSLIRSSWENEVYQNVSDFIDWLEATAPSELFKAFLQTGYTPGEPPAIESKEAVFDFIERSNLPDTEKWKLSYLYMNLEQTKKRFIRLIRDCYEIYFKKHWTELKDRQGESLTQLFKPDIVSGRRDLLSLFPYLNKDSLDNPKYTIVIAPSFFYHDASFNSDNEHSMILLYGIRQPDFIQQRSFDEQAAIEALKILSDEKRIKMIKLLSISPLYGYEIAQKLQLSNSTVSHHLSMLSTIGLVSSTRRENRVYFEVNKEAISQLMSNLTDILTH